MCYMRDLASIIKYWRTLSSPSEEWCRAVQDTSREFVRGIIIADLREGVLGYSFQLEHTLISAKTRNSYRMRKEAGRFGG